MTIISAMIGATLALANPYPNENLVPRDPAGKADRKITLQKLSQTEGTPVLRVRVDWDESSESYRLGGSVRENSGTPALAARATRPDALGSYKAVLKDAATGAALAHDAIGTGQDFRKLTRALTFRFPLPASAVLLDVDAENPRTGKMEKVLEARIDPTELEESESPDTAPEVRLVRAATAGPKLLVNIYAEGYPADDKEKFWSEAAKVAEALDAADFPLRERFELRAVFAPSNESLGAAKELGLPVPERDSHLGLYYPYWRKFGRWYHVVYPTREERFRAALGRVAYDYPIVLVDSDAYWGVGNYKELTAIPAGSRYFTYLLTHEFGHFFGLNEEYEGGGATELAFAPEIEEPWSQNITFLRNPTREALKWSEFVENATPLPTPARHWNEQKPLYGAYLGGYGDTEPSHQSHKPGLKCTMERAKHFCPICHAAIEKVIRHDLGATEDRLTNHVPLADSR
jgi:hypothetical protein